MKTREFILRALKARTSPDFRLSELPEAGRMDLVCRTVSNALWISNDLRRDTIIYVCMDGPKLPPKTISFSGAELKGVEPDERNIGEKIKLALEKGRNLSLNESTEVWPGITIAKKSFEALVREKAKTSNIYYLHKKGEDIRKLKFGKEVCFVFGDYIGMPRKTECLLDRFGAERVSLGPTMLFASHLPIIIHNELDRRAD